MTKLKMIAFLFILLAFSEMNAQWNAMLTVNPNPSPFVSRWERDPNVAVLTITYTGTSSQDITLDLRISESRSGEMLKANSRTISFFTGQATQTFTSLDYLDWNSVKYNSKIKDFVTRTGRLPEGNYTFCIYVMKGNTKLTEACADFKILLPDPPQLLAPANGDSINTNLPAFQWTPVIVPPEVTIVYKFKLCEVLYRQTPQKALNANKPIHEAQIISSNILQYPPDAFPLESGKTYVWQLQTFDLDSNEPISSNNGKSEIWTFKYKQNLMLFDKGFQKSKDKDIAAVKVTGGIWDVVQGFTTVSGEIFYQSGQAGDGAARSLKNTNIRLVLAKEVGNYVIGPLYGSSWSDIKSTLATAVTDDQGKFNFFYVDTTTMGVIKNNYDYYTGGEMGTHHYGDLKIVAKIIVDNPYFTSPATSLIIQPGESREVGTLFTTFRSYFLTVKVMPEQNVQGQLTTSPLKFVNVKLLRINRPVGVPADEGTAEMPRENLSNYEILAEGETDDNGEIKFRRLVKNIGPNDSYWIRMETDTTRGKYFYQLLYSSYQFPQNYNDYAVFRNEYTPFNMSVTKYLTPVNPRVAGYVYRADNQTQPVKDATVRIWSLSLTEGNKIEREMKTLSNGYFFFRNLLPEINTQGDVVGPYRALPVFKYGFRDTMLAINNSAPLNKGEQFVFEAPILLQPYGNASGRIVSADEFNVGVESNVKLGDGPPVTTTTKVEKKQIGNMNAYIPTFGWFETPAALGHNQPVYIQPFSGYFPRTIYKSVTTQNQDLGLFLVKKKLHRINLVVKYSGNINIPFALLPPVENALVGIDGLAPFTYTDDDGLGALQPFESCGNQFVVKIKGSSFNEDIVARELAIDNHVSENPVSYPVKVKKATRISGHVYVGKDNKPVPYAHVYLVGQTTSDKIETWTDVNGAYTLKGIPIGTHEFAAVKGKSQYVGDTQSIDCPQGGKDNVDFHLKVYDGMDITKLLGFPVAVQSLDSTSQGIKISGEIFELQKDSIFAPANSNTSLGFSNVYIIPGKQLNSDGVPIAVPKSLPVRLIQPSLNLKMNNVFNVTLEDDNGIALSETKTGNGIGVLKGKIFFNAATSLQNINELELDGFYISQTSSSKAGTKIKAEDMIINSLSAPGSNINLSTEKFLVSDDNGNALNYSYFSFDLESVTGKSYLSGDTIRLNSSLKGDIENASSINVYFDLVLHHNSIEEVNGNSPLNVTLSQKWSLQTTKWSLDQNKGFNLKEGKLITGSLDVPFTDLNILPSTGNKFKLANGIFNLDAMTLAGFVPIKIDPAATKQFGYDASKQKWILGVASNSGRTAFFTYLPGMEMTDSVFISNFILASEGFDAFNISPTTPPLTIYKVATFSPSALTAGNNLLQINGAINLNVPGTSIKSTALNYSVKNGNISFGFDNFPFFISTNGIYAQFDGNVEEFSDFGFKAKGTIIDEEKPDMFKFNVWLYRTKDSTSLWLESNQKFVFTKNNTRMLTNLVGTMRVVSSSAWDNFHFNGDLTGATGASGKLGFEVVGSILPGPQQLKLENIDTPFGQLAFLLDFEHGRLVGSMDINMDLSGKVHVDGHLSTVIDERGWYFLGAGNFTLDKPVINLAAAVLFGHYPSIANTDEFQQVFLADPNKYTYNGMVPQYLQDQLSGFYFTGRATIPFPLLPTIDIELDPLLECYVTPTFGGFLALGMNFGSSNAYYLNAGVYVSVKAGLGASVIIGCAGASLSGTVVLYGQGELNLSSGSWYVEGGADLILSGSAYVGVGCCDSDCDCALEEFDVCVCGGCLSDGWSGSKTIPMLKVRLGEGGPKFCAFGLCN